MKKPLVIAITGAAGQIAYSLLPRLSSGEIFGKDQSLHLKLIETEHSIERLKGVIMELEDCAFPCLQKITATIDLEEGFKDANWVLMIGSVPRKQGMERKDLLDINGKIFIEQGRVIAEKAAENVRILVVGNPCNTNCLIALHQAKGKIPANRFFAMSRLDENRSKASLAKKAGLAVEEVSHLAIWGNHSSTQYPDTLNTKIAGKKIREQISDIQWLESDFIKEIQQRGAKVIEARGASSAFSAANSALDTIKDLITPSQKGEWHSVCVYSSGEYGFPKDLVISLPIRTKDEKTWEVVEDLKIDAFSKEKIDISIAELIEEKESIQHLLVKSSE